MADKQDINQVKIDSERCLGIYIGEKSSCECSLCQYKEFGSNCVLELIKAQNEIIKEYIGD